jgi:peptide/nickel transport system substrate-binding protein
MAGAVIDQLVRPDVPAVFGRRTRARRQTTKGKTLPGILKQLLGAAALIFAALVSGAPVQAAGAADSSIVIVLPVERGNLDPMLLNTAVKNNYIFAVFNALFSFDKEGVLQPGLALREDVSADGLTHTLTLREAVTFHDGSPFTSDDVVFSLDRTKNDPRSVNKSYLALLDSASIEGPYKVALHLNKPFAGLSKALAYLGGIIVPKKYVETVGEDKFNKAPIGTGPYAFVSDSPGAGLVLRANENYWSPEKARVKTVTLRVLSDPNAAMAQLQTGEADFVWSVPASQVQVLKAANFVTQATSTQNKIYAQFNVIKYPVYRDTRVAQAFNYAVDRAQIVKAVYRGLDVTLIGTLDSPGRPGYDPSITMYPYDPERAKQLLKEANFDFSQPVTIQVPGTDYLGAADAAQAMAAQLKKVGIEATSVVKESASSWDDFRKKSSEPLAFINVPNPFNDPLGPMGAVMLCGQPYSMNCNANLDASMTAAGALSGAAYEKAVFDIDKWVHDNPPGIFLWELPNISAMSSKVVWTPTQARPWFKLTDFSLR